MAPGNRFMFNPPLPEHFKKAAWRMREKPTRAEKRLWEELRLKRLDGFRFRQQHSILPYIVDFFCFQAKLVIEVDGSSHIGRETEDRIRDQNLNNLGYTILRFTNDQVKQLLEDVKATIIKAAQSLVEHPREGSRPELPNPPSGG